MITTVTLNPCIDRTVYVDTLTAGGHHKAKRSLSQIGGKGLNVSGVLAHLGIETRCTGLKYTEDAAAVDQLLAAQKIPGSFLPVPGRLRVNLKLTESSGRMTEINESGTPVEEDTSDRLLALLAGLLPDTDLLVVSGSVPPGIRTTIYSEMITQARKAGVRTVLDASGELLCEGLKARPWLVKPNRLEMETLLGRPLPDMASSKEAARSLLGSGTEIVCLSLGGDGAMLANPDGTWFCGNLDIPVLGVQGAGDSMVAGLCAAHQQGLSGADMLRWGVAAAHASLILPGTELCRKEDMERFLAQLKTEVC